MKVNSVQGNVRNESELILKRLENHLENCLKNNRTKIAFSSTHYVSHQQKILLHAVQYFLDNYPESSMAIVTFSLDSGFFKELKNQSIPDEKGEIFSYQKNITLISWESLMKNNKREEILAEFDMTFWELPETDFISQHELDLKPMLNNLDSLFLVSNRLKSQDDSHFSESIAHYFQVHGIKIHGLFSEDERKKTGEKRSFFSRLLKKAS